MLYGITGEGMDHATRSRVVLEHLLAAGDSIRVVVSGRAHALISVDDVHGAAEVDA
ncbi:MAG: glycosyltransferase family protein [Myxococcota bacterium]